MTLENMGSVAKTRLTGVIFVALALAAMAVRLRVSGSTPVMRASAPKVPIGGTNGLFLASREVDVHDLAPGDLGNAEFVFENRGALPVTLEDVKPSCGCTSASGVHAVIAPGKKWSLRLTVDTTLLSAGPFDKTALCDVREGNRVGRVLLTVVGRVAGGHLVWLFPAHLDISSAKTGAVVERVFYARGLGDAVRSLPESVNCACSGAPTPPSAAVDVSETSGAAGLDVKAIRVNIQVGAPDSEGHVRGVIKFKFHGTSADEITLPMGGSEIH